MKQKGVPYRKLLAMGDSQKGYKEGGRIGLPETQNPLKPAPGKRPLQPARSKTCK